MKDLVGNNIKVGDLCYYLKTGASVKVCIVEILEFSDYGAICKVISEVFGFVLNVVKNIGLAT